MVKDTRDIKNTSKNREKKLVSEYANRLSEPSALYDIPYPVTIKCPECGCIDVYITGIKHEISNKSDGNDVSGTIIEFEGECSHRWNIEFASVNGVVYMGDSHCGEDIMIYRTEPEDQPASRKVLNNKNKNQVSEGLKPLFG